MTKIVWKKEKGLHLPGEFPQVGVVYLDLHLVGITNQVLAEPGGLDGVLDARTPSDHRTVGVGHLYGILSFGLHRFGGDDVRYCLGVVAYGDSGVHDGRSQRQCDHRWDVDMGLALQAAQRSLHPPSHLLGYTHATLGYRPGIVGEIGHFLPPLSLYTPVISTMGMHGVGTSMIDPLDP